ncbi:MAG: DUF998 domain-containing protein [Nakamurella sp.]
MTPRAPGGTDTSGAHAGGDTASADSATTLPSRGPHGPSRELARPLALFGIGGALVAIVGVGLLHVLPETAGVDQVRRTISEYALTELGWVFNLGVAALAVGSLAILVALVLAGRARGSSLGVALGAVWAAALLVVMVFPKHNWAVGPSTNGSIHRVASIVAFLCLPIAVLLLTKQTRERGSRVRQAAPARFAFWLAVLSLGWFGVLLGAWALTPVTGTPWWQAVPLGLVERGLVISEVLAVIALGCWAFRAGESHNTDFPTGS